MKRSCSNLRDRTRRGFTLVEIMVSMAIVVLLLLGINQVFKASSDIVGAGNAVTGMVRDGRSLQSVLQQDARCWTSDAPAFFIVSQQDSTTKYRRDYMAFPTRGVARKVATNSDTVGFANWVWYGHPADGANTLSRFSMIFGDPSGDSSNNPLATLSATMPPVSTTMTLDQLRAALTAGTATVNTGRLTTINPKADRALVPNCTDFVIEFAGDYVTQNADGTVASAQPDRVLDFYIHPLSPGKSLRLTRWYGYPRDTCRATAGSNFLGADGVVTRYASGKTNNDLVDVCPVADVISTLAVGTAPFEKTPLPTTDGSGTTTGSYQCVWTNDAPRMIRIGVRIEDPTQRIKDGFWFEYVIGPQ